MLKYCGKIFLYLALIIAANNNCFAVCDSAYTDSAGFLVCNDPSNTDNCSTSAKCNVYSCGSAGGSSPICDSSATDIISGTFLKMIAANLTMIPSKSVLGMANTEGAYVKCNATNDALQSCRFGGNFTATSNIAEANANTKKQAFYLNKPLNKTSSNALISLNTAPIYCPLTRCDVVSPNIQAVYNYNNTSYPITVTPGQPPVTILPFESTGGIGGFTAVQIGDTPGYLCLAVMTPMGLSYVGCKTPPLAPVPPGSISSACSASGIRHSQAFFSVTGRIMECVTSTFTSVFCTTDCSSTNIVSNLQFRMQNIVQTALILYVIIFGIRTALGQEAPHKGEILMALAKMILVIYFSVGYDINGTNSSGMIDYVYPLLVGAMDSFSDMIFQASSSSLCVYPASGYESQYSYLSLWDSVDCRLGFYLGFYSIFAPSANGIYGILSLIFPLLFAMKILFIIFMLCLGIFLLSIIVYFVHVYILALLGITMLTYLAPIFVPLSLFEQTKSYFDGWLRLLFSFTLQPVVITAFLAIMLSVFDGIMFTDCGFTSDTMGSYVYWTVDQSTASSTCQNSFGYQLNSAGNGFSSINALFFTMTIFNVSETGPFFHALMQALLFCIFFYFFSSNLGSFAAELTGGCNLSANATGATKIMDAAASKVKEKASKKDGKEKKDGPEGVEAKGDKGGGGGGGK